MSKSVSVETVAGEESAKCRCRSSISSDGNGHLKLKDCHTNRNGAVSSADHMVAGQVLPAEGEDRYVL